jgi:molybdate transport system substrate-binding protein
VRPFALAALLIAALARGAGADDELMVAAAVSLREPLEAVARAFESEHAGARVQLAFGATSALAAQVRAGAPLDVFVSADQATIDALVAEGLVRRETARPIAGNRLVVVVAPGVTARIARAGDLLRPELRRIALPERAVPLGHYAREWLARVGLLAALEPRLVATEHARATLAAVDDAHADAGIVYATDARTARAARVAFTPPDQEQPRILYVAAPLARARAPERAEAFLASLLSAEGRRELEAAGFAAPPVQPR